MAVDQKYGAVVAERGDRVHGDPGVPLNESYDEPCFVIRAQDAAALRTVRAWIDEAQRLGASVETLASAQKACDAIEEWQAANRGRVKVPD